MYLAFVILITVPCVALLYCIKYICFYFPQRRQVIAESQSQSLRLLHLPMCLCVEFEKKKPHHREALRPKPTRTKRTYTCNQQIYVGPIPSLKMISIEMTKNVIDKINIIRDPIRIFAMIDTSSNFLTMK